MSQAYDLRVKLASPAFFLSQVVPEPRVAVALAQLSIARILGSKVHVDVVRLTDTAEPVVPPQDLGDLQRMSAEASSRVQCFVGCPLQSRRDFGWLFVFLEIDGIGSRLVPVIFQRHIGLKPWTTVDN